MGAESTGCFRVTKPETLTGLRSSIGGTEVVEAIKRPGHPSMYRFWTAAGECYETRLVSTAVSRMIERVTGRRSFQAGTRRVEFDRVKQASA